MTAETMGPPHTHTHTEAGSYLGGSEEADGLQVFHAVSVLGVDAFKQVNLLLQDLRLSVDHAHDARLKHSQLFVYDQDHYCSGSEPETGSGSVQQKHTTFTERHCMKVTADPVHTKKSHLIIMILIHNN